MQAMFEIVFYITYLGVILTLGYFLLKSKGSLTIHNLFGLMAFILAIGQSFYIIAKIIALINEPRSEYIALVGIGRLVDSVAVTLFFLILYLIYKLQYSVNNQNTLEIIFCILVASRIILCAMPQNQWINNVPSSLWGIYRNIPFFIMGIFLMALFIKEINNKHDKDFIFMPFAILLSFLFYLPVVIWVDKNPVISFFMVPTLLCYLWIIWMGYVDMKKSIIKSEVLI